MIGALVADGVIFLMSMSASGLLSLFWIVVLFELPVYTCRFLAVFAVGYARRDDKIDRSALGKVSVVISGHNEAETIEQCVRSLNEQSWPPDEIVVVSDGSTDLMSERLRELQRSGAVSQVHCVDLRSGKSAATNLAIGASSGDIVINVDCDCSFDRDAFKFLLHRFGDPAIGAVCGNIAPRNVNTSFIAGCQAIEYLISISLSKLTNDLFGQVTCVSGAFGAFRRSALDMVGGLDAGGGEDLDMTLRLRKAGWEIGFAHDAICYTDVPSTLIALTNQRFRWERDAIRLQMRKHRETFDPFARGFRPREALSKLEFLIFNVLSAAAMPFYLVWLFDEYGSLAPAILAAALIGLMVLDLIVLVMAALVTPGINTLPYLLLLPGYSGIYCMLMRHIRLGAYLQEWLLESSYKDEYVPAKVRARAWRL